MDENHLLRVSVDDIFAFKETGASRLKHWQDFHPPSSWYQRTVYPAYLITLTVAGWADSASQCVCVVCHFSPVICPVQLTCQVVEGQSPGCDIGSYFLVVMRRADTQRQNHVCNMCLWCVCVCVCVCVCGVCDVWCVCVCVCVCVSVV